MRELMPEVVEDIDRRRADRHRVTGVPTGFRDLDSLMRGLQPEDLVVVAARTSMGKTSFILNIVEHAALVHGRRCGVFSLEMGRKALGARLLASQAGIDHQRLTTGYIAESQWSKVSEAIVRLSDSGIYIDDSSTATVFDVRAKARGWKANGGLDLIAVDYLQLMTGTHRAENKNLEVAEITRALKAVARDLGVPVLLLSQLSREPDKRNGHRPQLSDLRDSGAIEQDADVVLMIHREEYYARTKENHGVADIIIAKHRNGPVGTVRLAWIPEQTRFSNVNEGSAETTNDERLT
jgi:replicative DNA helicase